MPTTRLTQTAVPLANRINTNQNAFTNHCGSAITIDFSNGTSQVVNNNATSLPENNNYVTGVNCTATHYYPSATVTLTHNVGVTVTLAGGDVVFTY